MKTGKQPTAAMLQHGEVIAEGKTKIIRINPADKNSVVVLSKDDITAGDGAKHDIIPDKAKLATKTTCNVFGLLKAAGVPVAYNGQLNEVSFLSPKVTMIPLEVIIRREAHGSYCVRNPHVTKGTIFPRLVFELFLKTKDKIWGDIKLPCDDPLALRDADDGFELYDVKKPFIGQKSFAKVGLDEIFKSILNSQALLPEIEDIARKTFLILERQWAILGRRLVDFKIEFGIDDKGNLSVADVIDNDSWRLVKDGAYEDKQVYRDGGALSEVAANYRRIAELTDRFAIPVQRVVIWRGSEKDKVEPVHAALDDFAKNISVSPPNTLRPGVNLSVVTCSMHKESARGLHVLRELMQACHDCVIIAYVGRSNGAGPTLQAHTTMQVINCSPSVKEFPDDIWSSLRMPSEVPCVTVMDPGNAAHAALNQLARNNPALYAALQSRVEARLEI